MSDYFYTAQLHARQVSEETGLSLREIAELPLDEWSRLTHGETPAQAAHRALEAKVAGMQHQEPALPGPAPVQPEGTDVASMDMATYAQFRQAAGIGAGRKEGRGIFDSVGSRSREFTDAARAQAGRTGWAGTTTEAPRLTGRQERQGQNLDTRTAAQRFGTPSNAFNL